MIEENGVNVENTSKMNLEDEVEGDGVNVGTPPLVMLEVPDDAIEDGASVGTSSMPDVLSVDPIIAIEVKIILELDVEIIAMVGPFVEEVT